MLQRFVVLAVVVAAAYWYWTGPMQHKKHPDYEATLQQNAQKMAECKRAAAYKLGATGIGSGSEVAEQACAEKYNLYEEDGRWHSYNLTRPN
ncbi:MAG: hypothetical protein R3E64_03845 [Halioglobus sp.]